MKIINKVLIKQLMVVVLLSLLLPCSILPVTRCAQILDLDNDLSAAISATATNNDNATSSGLNNNDDYSTEDHNTNDNINSNAIVPDININNNNNISTSSNKSTAYLLLVSTNQIATLGLNITSDVLQVVHKDNNQTNTNETSVPVELIDADIHLQKNYLFVTDSAGSIRRFNLPSTDNHELVNESHIFNSESRINNKIKISVDWSRNLLYVSEQSKLLSMDLNGDDISTILDDFNLANKPISIKVDPKSGYIFWLSKGNFTNTIYSFNLQQRNKPFHSSRDAVPIIQDLPSSIELFLIDYKLSRIYVPFPNTTSLFVQQHLPNTLHNSDLYQIHHSSEEIVTQQDGTCDFKYSTNAKIMAYNFDGTDRGPVRHKDNVLTASILDDFDHLLDLSIDEEGYFYWLAKPGVISQEYKDEDDDCYRHIVDNYQDKFQFSRMMLVSSSAQPMIKTRSITNKTQSAIRSINENQLQQDTIYINNNFDSQRYKSSTPESWHIQSRTSTDKFFNSNTNFTMVSSFVFLMGIVVIIGLLLKRRNSSSTVQDTSRPNNVDQTDTERYNTGSGATDSCINHSRNNADDALSRYYRPSTINTGTSYNGEHLTHIAIDSSSSTTNNFDRENHIHPTTMAYDMGLAKTNCWPINGNESNNVYVPAEILQDPVLSKIPRLTIDQLKIEKNACLGSGFFGTVYIGTVIDQRYHDNGRNEKININQNRHSQLLRYDSRQLVSNNRHVGVSEGGSCCDQIMTPSALSVASSFTPTSASSSCLTSSSSAITNSNNNNNHSYINTNNCQSSSICTPKQLTSGEGYLTPITLHDNCDCQITIEDNNKRMLINNYDERTREHFKNQATSSSCYYDLSASTIDNSNCQQRLVEKLVSLGSNNNSTIKGQMRVAIKRLKDGAAEDDRNDFLQEAKMLFSCRHKNIVTLLGICPDRGSTLIIMELMAGGDLQKYLQERRPKSTILSENVDMNLNEDDLVSICLDIANGLCYLEQQRYVHRDLAARNCLVSSILKKDRVVKISDFGLARDIYQSDYYINKGRKPVPARWLAPECLSDNRYTIKSDVWSFGVLMWEIMTYCQRPYADIDIGNGSNECSKLKDFLRTGERLPRPDPRLCSDEIYSLMNNCWALEPEDRPSFQECRNSLISIRDGIISSVVI